MINQLYCPAAALLVVFLVLAVLVYCACVMAGRAADNADEMEKNL